MFRVVVRQHPDVHEAIDGGFLRTADGYRRRRDTARLLRVGVTVTRSSFGSFWAFITRLPSDAIPLSPWPDPPVPFAFGVGVTGLPGIHSTCRSGSTVVRGWFHSRESRRGLGVGVIGLRRVTAPDGNSHVAVARLHPPLRRVFPSGTRSPSRFAASRFDSTQA